MHLDVLREVAREDLCHKEAIVEGSADIFDGVAQIEGLDPLEHLARQTSGSRVLRGHHNCCCHFSFALDCFF